MDRRLSELEKLALTQVDGQTTLRIEGAGNGIETPVPSVRLSQLQRDSFTLVDGQVAVRVTGTTSGGGGSCTVESSVSVESLNWKNGTSLLGSSINFSQDNTGFQVKYKAGSGNIIALCENMLVTPLPTTSGAMGDLSISTLTLDGVSIAADVTSSFSNGVLTVDYDTKIPNPNFSTNTTFTIVASLLLGTMVVPPITSILTYLGPRETLSISTPNRLFDTTYTTASISRSFPSGAQTSIDETTFGGVAQTAGATSITFTALDRNATVAQRTLSEKVTYTNGTDSTATVQLTTTTILNPIIQFPVYLGNEDTMATPSASSVNNYQKVGTFTSAPGDQQFMWDDPMNNDLENKVFAIRTTFFSGTILFKANQMATLTNEQTVFANVNIGDISTATENYSLYRAAANQPGAASIYVDFV